MNHCATCRKELPDLELTCYNKYTRVDGTTGKSFHCNSCREFHIGPWNKSIEGKKYRSFRSSLQNKLYPEKHLARTKFNYHLKVGNVKRKPCEVCGNLKVQGHHENYGRFLDIIWLCSMHHAEVHKTKQLQTI